MSSRPANPARSALVPVAGFLSVLTIAAIIIEPRVAAVAIAGLLCLWRAVLEAPEEDELAGRPAGIMRGRRARSARRERGR